MSSANVIRDGFPGGNRRSYISTDTFTNRFYSYTTRTIDGVTTGIFADVTDDDTLCPKGRILRENGRKLFPGANPDVRQYMVGVYDAKTFLNGFIDPNSRVFSSFNTDKSYYIDNDLDSDHGSVGSGDSGGEDLGDPVYTRGMIETISGDILANPNGGDNYISLRNDISGSSAYFGFNNDTEPYMGVETDGASGYVGGSIHNSGLLHPYNACGQVTLGTTGGAGASTATVTINSDIPLNSDALVFLSHVTVTNAGGGGDTNGFLRYTFPGGNVLRINSTGQNDTSIVNYLIVSKLDITD